MNFGKIEIGTQHISAALEHLAKGDMEQAIQLVSSAVDLNVPIPELHLIRAVCIADMGFNHLARQALHEELTAFPENSKARIFLERLEASACEPLKMNQPVTSYPLISFVLVRTNKPVHYHTVLESLLQQKYRNIELIVVDTTPPVADEVLTDSRCRSVAAFQKNGWEALLLGLQAASGKYLSVINEDTVTYHDNSLSGVAEYLCMNGHVDFITCDRSYLNEAGIPNAMRCSKIRWNRSLLFDPVNFTPPMLSLRLCQAVWSSQLFASCDWSYKVGTNSIPKEAIDFAVFARLMRHATPVALALPLCVSRVPVKAGNEELSIRYVAEALTIIDDEISRRDATSTETTPGTGGVPMVEFVGPNSNPSGNGLENFINPLLPKEAMRTIHERPPKISLVTPSFNQGEYLEETIDSILSQEYPNLEYIIIDGGSTDNSVEIIRKYSKYLTYWCSEKDGGQYYAIQKGLMLSTGEIQSWLNSDDKLAPFSLNTIAYVLQVCPYINWISGLHGVIIDKREFVHAQPHKYSRKQYLYRAYDRPFIQQEGTFWRTSLWEKAGGSLDLRHRLAGDMELWTRFFRFEKLYTLNCSVAKYRKHSLQRSQLFLAEYHREAYKIIQEELSLVNAGFYAEMLDAPDVVQINEIIEKSSLHQRTSGLVSV